MAQDDPPPGGLLSKVVKFVRNPTVNWADLDQPEDKESHYSKQMLKEMIERKRANDFVRRREFDQLRKLRLRGPLAGPLDADGAARVSFFNTSQPSKDDDRAGTLKKIDEIEAQMSQQWWKGRGERPASAAAPAPAAPGAEHPAPPPVAPGSGADDAPPYFATTIDASLPLADDAFTPSVRAEAVLLEDLPALGSPAAARSDDSSMEPDWQSTPAFVETAPAYSHDPGLEEAAIRFANGDDAGAEAALLALLEPPGQQRASEEIWMTLFDLYRAVGPRDRFDALAAQFAAQFARAAPAWFTIGRTAAAVAPLPADEAQWLHWASPAALGAAELQALQSLLVQRRPAVVALDWSVLSHIETDAREPLAGLVMALAQQPIAIHCTAGAQFEGVLRRWTVSGDRSVHPGWWRLRLDWLRVTRQAEAFDLAALDYCVTFEVSPPAWSEAACSFTALDAGVVPPMSPAQAPHGDLQPLVAGELSGVLTEDATEALAPFERQTVGDGLVVVACDHLVRTDFAATGSILTWAAAQQAAGRRVQFRELHRLVATFFNVVGVGEYAAILSRRN